MTREADPAGASGGVAGTGSGVGADAVSGSGGGSAPSLDRGSFAVRLSLFYGALFLIYGIQVPYLPLWLDGRGLSPSEIAIVTAAPFFLRLVVTPGLALFADQREVHRGLVIGLSAAAFVLSLVLSQMWGFGLVFAVAMPLALAVSTIMPLTETIAMRGVRGCGLDYGRMRLWGSLTFIVAGLAGGSALDAWGTDAAIWLFVAGAAATAIAAPFLPRDTAGLLASSELQHPSRRLGLEGLATLVRTPGLVLFLFAAGAVQGAHATFYTFGALHWKALSLSSAATGGLWALAVIAEVCVFAWSRALAARFGPLKLLLAGAAAAVVRWSLMAFDPPMALLVPLQVLHGLTYGASHLGAMHYIAQRVPAQSAGTAQALYATMAAGIFMGAATLASGPLYKHYAGLAYLGPAVMAAAGLAALVILARRSGEESAT